MIKLLEMLKGCNYEEGLSRLEGHKIKSFDSGARVSIIKIRYKRKDIYYITNSGYEFKTFNKGGRLWAGFIRGKLVTSDYLDAPNNKMCDLEVNRSKWITACGDMYMYLFGNIVNIRTRELYKPEMIYDDNLNVKRHLWQDLYKYHIIKEMT